MSEEYIELMRIGFNDARKGIGYMIEEIHGNMVEPPFYEDFSDFLKKEYNKQLVCFVCKTPIRETGTSYNNKPCHIECYHDKKHHKSEKLKELVGRLKSVELHCKENNYSSEGFLRRTLNDVIQLFQEDPPDPQHNINTEQKFFKVLNRIHLLSHEADFAILNNKEVRPLLLEIDILTHDAIDKFCSKKPQKNNL